MLHGLPCWIDDLLDQLAAQVGRVRGLTPDRVFASLADDDAHAAAAPADTFAVIRPTTFVPEAAKVAGGGRVTTEFDSTIRVAMFSRLASDRELRDTRALRERSRSILRAARNLLGVLQTWTPTGKDADGNTAGLLTEPMRLRSMELVPRKLGAGGQTWAVAASVWQAKFRADLTPDPE